MTCVGLTDSADTSDSLCGSNPTRQDAAQYQRKSITTLSLHEPNDRKNHVVEDSIIQQLRAALIINPRLQKVSRSVRCHPLKTRKNTTSKSTSPTWWDQHVPCAGIKPNMWKWIKEEEPRDDVVGLTFVL